LYRLSALRAARTRRKPIMYYANGVNALDAVSSMTHAAFAFSRLRTRAFASGSFVAHIAVTAAAPRLNSTPYRSILQRSLPARILARFATPPSTRMVRLRTFCCCV